MVDVICYVGVVLDVKEIIKRSPVDCDFDVVVRAGGLVVVMLFLFIVVFYWAYF